MAELAVSLLEHYGVPRETFGRDGLRRALDLSGG
jgi:hypothetical protein